VALTVSKSTVVSTRTVTEYESQGKYDCAMQMIQFELPGCDFQCVRKDMVSQILGEEGITPHVDCLLTERIAEIDESTAKLESLRQEIVTKEM
jgi:hypothetical protein